jgi:hypothetical protein
MSFLRIHADEARICARGPHLGRQRSVELELDMTEAQWMDALSFMLSQTSDDKLLNLLRAEYSDLLEAA